MEESPGELVKIGTPYRYPRAQDACLLDAEFFLPLGNVFAKQMVELIRGHRLLEFRPLDDLAHERIRVQQYIIVKQHVVNADDSLVAQLHVVEKGRPGKKVHAESVVEVVVKIRAGRDDPVHKTGLHQRHDRRRSEPGRGERPGERHADRPVFGEHFFGEKAAALREARAVVGLECAVDQIAHAHVFRDRFRQQAGKFFVQ